MDPAEAYRPPSAPLLEPGALTSRVRSFWLTICAFGVLSWIAWVALLVRTPDAVSGVVVFPMLFDTTALVALFGYALRLRLRNNLVRAVLVIMAFLLCYRTFFSVFLAQPALDPWQGTRQQYVFLTTLSLGTLQAILVAIGLWKYAREVHPGEIALRPAGPPEVEGGSPAAADEGASQPVGRTARDRRGHGVEIGARVRLIGLSRSYRASLSLEEQVRAASMIGEVFDVRDIDENGSAWVQKEWDVDDEGETAIQAVALAASEMELVEAIQG